MHPGEAPGLGVDIDEALAAKYPYEPAYLPMARKARRHRAQLVTAGGARWLTTLRSSSRFWTPTCRSTSASTTWSGG